MSFDNRIFNVNGQTDEDLLKTLELACGLKSDREKIIEAYSYHPELGMILYWSHDGEDKSIQLPSPMSAKEILPLVKSYLRSEVAKDVPKIDWENDLDHDGHNKLGWRVYVERWGKVDESSYAIVAIKSVYIWYGK